MEKSLDTDENTGSFKEKQDPYQNDSDGENKTKESFLSKQFSKVRNRKIDKANEKIRSSINKYEDDYD